MKNKSASVLWLMGPTSSGKTTLAVHYVKRLRSKGLIVLHYDGDEVRNFFGDEHGFSDGDRLRVVRTLVLLANKAVEAGIAVVVSALTANPDARKLIASEINKLTLVYVKCSLEVCARRDPKGLYAKARRGEIETLVGYNSTYLPPENPDIILNTEINSIEFLTNQLDEFLF